MKKLLFIIFIFNFSNFVFSMDKIFENAINNLQFSDHDKSIIKKYIESLPGYKEISKLKPTEYQNQGRLILDFNEIIHIDTSKPLEEQINTLTLKRDLLKYIEEEFVKTKIPGATKDINRSLIQTEKDLLIAKDKLEGYYKENVSVLDPKTIINHKQQALYQADLKKLPELFTKPPITPKLESAHFSPALQVGHQIVPDVILRPGYELK